MIDWSEEPKGAQVYHVGEVSLWLKRDGDVIYGCLAKGTGWHVIPDGKRLWVNGRVKPVSVAISNKVKKKSRYIAWASWVLCALFSFCIYLLST